MKSVCPLLLATLGLVGLATPAQAGPDPLTVAAKIDQRIQAVLDANKARPAPVADDAEFLRRVYLDIIGRIPPVSEVHEFLADTDPNKRVKLIEKLLSSNGYVNNFAAAWRVILVPPSPNQQSAFLAAQVESWFREKLREEIPYDVAVRELITLPIGNPQQPQVRQRFVPGQGPNPRSFYQANEFRPENIAASVSRVFLGVKMECAQCHNHPFAKWSREQFWQQAAFFVRIQPQENNGMVFNGTESDKGLELTIPNPNSEKKVVVTPKFLDGSPIDLADANPREVLARWLTAKNNPYFARATVNRLWAHFFGLGLADPVDEMGEEATPSHPELLDDLARAFVESDYDFKFLIRAIVNSQTYQRSSIRTDASQDEPSLFARMSLKGMTAEQLFDSLCQATGYRDGQRGAVMPQVVFPGQGSARAEFMAKFSNSVDKKTEVQKSILQALAMMNGQFMAGVTNVQNSKSLAAILDSPFMEDRDRLQTLFLAVLSRPMRPDEEVKFLRYIEAGGPSGDPRQALADVFWVLLNSAEFSLNH
jgi:hypothetical protein